MRGPRTSARRSTPIILRTPSVLIFSNGETESFYDGAAKYGAASGTPPTIRCDVTLSISVNRCDNGRVVFVFAILLLEAAVASSQNAPDARDHARREDADHVQTVAPLNRKNLRAVAERLRQSVNGKAIVRNRCRTQRDDAQVEENTQIAAINGCSLIFKTRKTTTSRKGLRELEFTLFADLGDLTTPPSVEPQTFSQCEPVGGTVLKVTSRAAPGKVVRVTRRAHSNLDGGRDTASEPETQATRNDLSFFFPNAAAAKRGARVLGQAVKMCGGKEWPDEDDLP